CRKRPAPSSPPPSRAKRPGLSVQKVPLDTAAYPIQSCIVSVEDVDTRPRRRRAETVERLLDAALQTFAEIGFAAASVEDICRRGGFTRGAFYSSFRTKDELFAALFTRETDRNLALVEEQLIGLEAED